MAENGRVIVNCLPLTAIEQADFAQATADTGVEQLFVGDPAQRGEMTWRAPQVPQGVAGRATAVIGNLPTEACGPTAMPRLEWLQTWSAGVDRYLAPGVLAPQVVVTNASGAYGQAVSEHMFAMLWALAKNLPQYARNQTKSDWQDAGRALSPADMTILVIGTGDIGSHFATLCKAVGAHTIGVRRDPSHPATPPEAIDQMIGFDQLDVALPQADAVALCVPSTSATRRLIDARRLSLMKPTAILLNAGRGDAIDTEALPQALASGTIRAAGLDVTDPEPLPADHPLWNQPNALITPHVAGGNHLPATERRIIAIALENVRRYAASEPLANVVRR